MPHGQENKDYTPTIHIPFTALEESRHWKVGQAYRVKAVLRQVSMDEDGAVFELVDVTSLDSSAKEKRFFYSDGGVLKI